jgi:hypothetical protein
LLKNDNYISITNLIGTNGNFISSDNGLGTGCIAQSIETNSVSNNIQTFKNFSQNGNIRCPPPSNNSVGDIMYACAYVKSESNLVGIKIKDNTTTKVTTLHSNVDQWEFLSCRYTAASGEINLNPSVQDTRSSGFTDVQFKQMHFLNLTLLFGSGFEPSKNQMDYYIFQYINNYGYINTCNVNFKDALALNFVFNSSSGLNLDNPSKPFWQFDGLNDNFNIQHTPNLDITSPPLALFATHYTGTPQTSYIFSKAFDATTNMQYAINLQPGANRIYGVVVDNGQMVTSTTNAYENNTWYDIGFIYTRVNGVNIYKFYINGVLNNTTTNTDVNRTPPFTGGRQQIRIGCRPNAGSTNTAFMKGGIANIAIYSGDKCTEANILASRKAISKAYL